jgi:hypothetical protein
VDFYVKSDSFIVKGFDQQMIGSNKVLNFNYNLDTYDERVNLLLKELGIRTHEPKALSP